MTLFPTTEEQQKKIPKIAKEMTNTCLFDSFVDEWAKLAKTDQGVFELGELWFEEKTDSEERLKLEEAINDILIENEKIINRTLKEKENG